MSGVLVLNRFMLAQKRSSSKFSLIYLTSVVPSHGREVLNIISQVMRSLLKLSWIRKSKKKKILHDFTFLKAHLWERRRQALSSFCHLSSFPLSQG